MAVPESTNARRYRPTSEIDTQGITSKCCRYPMLYAVSHLTRYFATHTYYRGRARIEFQLRTNSRKSWQRDLQRPTTFLPMLVWIHNQILLKQNNFVYLGLPSRTLAGKPCSASSTRTLPHLTRISTQQYHSKTAR